MEFKVVMLLVWIHYFGDFLAQTNEMAMNKSRSNRWLLLHTTVYSIPLLFFGLLFTAVNFAIHFVTDYFTSRMGSYFRSRENHKGFFIVLGLDQAFHLTTLFITYRYLGSFPWF